MIKEENTQILILSKEDLFEQKSNKHISEIDLNDFKIELENFYKSELVLFTDDDGNVKILKSRHTKREIFGNYQIVKNEKIMQDFIDGLPDLQSNEKYYFCLFARAKYCKSSDIKSDKAQLKRFIANKHNAFDKIKQLEVQLGNYRQNGRPIPQEALALYVNPNPRCMKTATRKSLVKFAELIANDNSGYNPHQEVLSQIQQSCSRKIWIDFDFDGVEFESIREQLFDSINPDALKVLKTRGGIHVLVETEKIHSSYAKTWYNRMSNINGCDIKGDNLVPVPGSYQGGFVPHFVDITSF